MVKRSPDTDPAYRQSAVSEGSIQYLMQQIEELGRVGVERPDYALALLSNLIVFLNNVSVQVAAEMGSASMEPVGEEVVPLSPFEIFMTIYDAEAGTFDLGFKALISVDDVKTPIVAVVLAAAESGGAVFSIEARGISKAVGNLNALLKTAGHQVRVHNVGNGQFQLGGPVGDDMHVYDTSLGKRIV